MVQIIMDSQFGHMDQNPSQQINNIDLKHNTALLFLYPPRPMPLEVRRTQQFEFSQDATAKITDMVRSAQYGNGDVTKQIQRSVMLDPDMNPIMPTQQHAQEINMGAFSSWWTFVLVITLYKPGSSWGTMGRTASKYIYSGFCSDEPVNPLTMNTSSPTINPNARLEFTHSTIISEDYAVNAMGAHGIAHPRSNTHVINTAVANYISDDPSGENQLYYQDASNIVNTFRGTSSEFDYNSGYGDGVYDNTPELNEDGSLTFNTTMDTSYHQNPNHGMCLSRSISTMEAKADPNARTNDLLPAHLDFSKQHAEDLVSIAVTTALEHTPDHQDSMFPGTNFVDHVESYEEQFAQNLHDYIHNVNRQIASPIKLDTGMRIDEVDQKFGSSLEPIVVPAEYNWEAGDPRTVSRKNIAAVAVQTSLPSIATDCGIATAVFSYNTYTANNITNHRGGSWNIQVMGFFSPNNSEQYESMMIKKFQKKLESVVFNKIAYENGDFQIVVRYDALSENIISIQFADDNEPATWNESNMKLASCTTPLLGNQDITMHNATELSNLITNISM